MNLITRVLGQGPTSRVGEVRKTSTTAFVPNITLGSGYTHLGNVITLTTGVWLPSLNCIVSCTGTTTLLEAFIAGFSTDSTPSTFTDSDFVGFTNATKSSIVDVNATQLNYRFTLSASFPPITVSSSCADYYFKVANRYSSGNGYDLSGFLSFVRLA